MAAAPTLLLSLSDVARVARVQRPVVSMWRSRSRASTSPFPAAVERRRGQELFAADAVARWLSDTGRGNNPTAAQDAAGFSAALSPSFTELTALLTLRSLVDEPLTGWEPADILDMADEVDPDDEFLYSELEAAGDQLTELSTAVDQIVEASFAPVAAFERLMTDRFRTGADGFARTAMAPALAELAALTSVAMADSTGATNFVEATPGGSDLLAALIDVLGETADAVLDTDAAPLAGTREWDGAAVRLSRRRLRVLTAHNDNLRTTAQHSEGTAPRMLLAQFPGPAAPDMTEADILSAVDELALSLNGPDAALVIAPATLLVGSLPRDLESQRSQTLRMGRLRAAVRLPSGLALAKARQPIAAWVLGAEQGQVPIAERRTMIADLSAHRLGPAERQDLVSDLVASLGTLRDVRGHAFRFARVAPTSSLLAEGGSLTDGAIRRGPPVADLDRQRAADILVQAEASLHAFQSAPAIQSDVGITLAPGSETPASWITLGELLDAGAVTVLPGTRLGEDELRTSPDGLPVWQPDTVRCGGRSPRARISLMDVASSHPSARLTEPGDVVLLTGSRPAACVDEEGAAVVRFPVRALRLAPDSCLVPTVLAQDLAAASGPWRKWRVRRFEPRTGAEMSAVLARLDAARRELTSRLSQLDDVTTLIVSGVTSGAVHATPLTEGTD
ncbi:hypothetical protein AB0333_06605 [Citricoccus sp. NPDC079358]|uniref:hypothetical protein n=1 Tax=Citricoccus sp. NPDC079358 TaxID=3154653 RepID=UPI00344FF3B3